MNAFRLLVAFIGCIALLPMSYAEQGYQTPSAELAALVDAMPTTLSLKLSTLKKHQTKRTWA